MYNRMEGIFMGRLRKKKGLLEKLLEKDNYLIKNPVEYKGKWKKIFGKDNLHIELGTGKGQFITTLAEKNEDVGYIGVEKIADVLFQAVKKAEASLSDIVIFFNSLSSAFFTA